MGTVTFYQNPFYDEVFGLRLPNPVPPKQRKGKKQNREFESQTREHLREMTNDNWPHDSKLLIVLSITGPEEYLNNCDIDNITKAVLDSCNGIVFNDDRQVFSLVVEKHIEPSQPSFLIGLRRMKHGEIMSFVPALFSEDENDWKEEREKKFGK